MDTIPDLNLLSQRSNSSLPTADLVQKIHLYEGILDGIQNGVIITDPDGYIVFMNKPYGDFIHVSPESQVGKHVTDVVENTRMHIVGQTGKAEINRAQRINGKEMVVQRIPIKVDGKVIAVYGQVIFKDLDELGRLAKKVGLLESKASYYEQELLSLRSTRYNLQSIAGDGSTVRHLKQIVQKSSATDLPVLITGESGTGKELFAQAVHHESNRKIYPFIRLNCAAIPKNLIESELFGYEKGAFTGADSVGKPGKFELAHRGSIFLDEIAELPLDIQPKLLRVLEEKEFERVGGKNYIQSNFRLIAATNQNLMEMVGKGSFRMDLFYRLNVIQIHIPPLRERREDILPLAHHMLRLLCEESSLQQVSLHPLAEKALVDYDWPGNARELHNVLARVLSFLDGDVIHLEDLLYYLSKKERSREPGYQIPLRDVVLDTEKETILKALAATNNNKVLAADMLGIHRTLLYKKMEKYGIQLRKKTGRKKGDQKPSPGRSEYSLSDDSSVRTLDEYLMEEL
ncbi:MAG TPA: sigma 54-interacting transcriptional regulator [Dissulfurispiraceae bacterium]|nr:sigma 54-interacting transcriptional regulator [Dissulfurispiraceae bacterium]